MLDSIVAKYGKIIKMEEKQVNNPGIPEEEYRTLGRKTLWLFVFERMNATLLFFLLAIVLLVAGGQKSLAATPFGNVAAYAMLGAAASAILFIVVFGVTFLVAWLIYSNYKFALGEDSLKIKRGILEKEEVAIPYRQIQDVDIERDISFQMMGLSRILILTAGHEDVGKQGGDDSEGILPALDKDLAAWLQQELLRRANIQKVTEEPSR